MTETTPEYEVIDEEDEMAGTEVAVRQGTGIAASDELTVDQMILQVEKIQQVMEKVMQDGTHYGVIPGTDKPTLYKPGAEKLCLLFRLDPEYGIKETREGNHLDVQVTCTLYHIPTGNRVASGVGFCTTRESKYGWRNAKRVCPNCGAEAIIKGKAEYGGGWICFKKIEGCGAKFRDGDKAIEDQEVGKVENPDLPDTYNTVIKMGCKRALVAAVLNATAASDIFSQDLEDLAQVTPQAAPEPEVDVVTDDTLEALITAIDQAKQYSRNWDPGAVVGSAARKFGRSIYALSDLTEDEAHQVLRGAEAFIADQQIEEGT